jgi:LysM repeat protein
MVRRWNGLHSGDGLRGRKVLALHLPVTPGGDGASTVSGSVGHPRKTSPTASTKAPSGKSARAKAGDERPSEPASVLRHKVKSGETLYSIATTYNTTVAALKRYNGNVAVLRPGMILIVQPAR